MKRFAFILYCLLLCRNVVAGEVAAYGTPFFVNYPSVRYGAHDRNADVVCDTAGYTYFANYEGILCYDGCEWELVTTPGISRITALALDDSGEVWAGGFNVVGKLHKNGNGQLEFKAFISDTGQGKQRLGEVKRIFCMADGVLFVAREALVWIESDSVRVIRQDEKWNNALLWDKQVVLQDEAGRLQCFEAGRLCSSGIPEIKGVDYTALCELGLGRKLLGTDRGLFVVDGKCIEKVNLRNFPSEPDVNYICRLEAGTFIVATAVHGLIFLDEHLNVITWVDKTNGLCCNAVNRVVTDWNGGVWGATDQGIFRLNAGLPFSRFTEQEGLRGEVLTMKYSGPSLYVGTYQGLYLLEAGTSRFVAVQGIEQVCWNLVLDGAGGLWAATGRGLFRVNGKKAVAVNPYFTLGVMADPGNIDCVYTGEMDGIYSNKFKNGKVQQRSLCAAISQVASLSADNCRNLWMVTLFGEVYRCRFVDGAISASEQLRGLKNELGNQIAPLHGQAVVVSRDGFYRLQGKELVPFRLLADTMPDSWWPGVCMEGTDGRLWLTYGDGKKIFTKGNSHPMDDEYNLKLNAIGQYVVRVVCIGQDNVVWVGGGFGLLRMELGKKIGILDRKPEILIRKVSRSGDGDRNIRFTYTLNTCGVIRSELFSCRLLGFDQEWGEWKADKVREYARLPYGEYRFQVKARDIFDRESLPAEYSFEVPWPFYLEWYAWGAYGGIFMFIIWLFFKWRTRQLLKEKTCLELVVEQRTHEIRLQHDQIRKKSEELEKTLMELNRTQSELIRQEKMATVGKLTKGLVDRILNPLNYINNFAGLSKGLSDEIVRITEKERERLGDSMYGDFREISMMLSGNLVKITEHGNSTTRIVKAMEEILRERNCVFVPANLNRICRINIEMLEKYFEREIQDYGITVGVEEYSGKADAEVDEVQLGKVLLSILNNGMLALLKKLKSSVFSPELLLRLELNENKAVFFIRDNGIGIEEGILDKIFDPFFTTRIAAEATGVGLYLSREVILNHRGEIHVCSEKGEFTEFMIEIPICRD